MISVEALTVPEKKNDEEEKQTLQEFYAYEN